MPAILISADDIKKQLPGYEPRLAGQFHVQSAKIADKLFDKYLKSKDAGSVILMSGGPASGKTEFVSEYLLDKEVLIYDGVLPTEKGAKIKIDHVRKTKKDLKIYAVWPEEIGPAYLAFLFRDRKYEDIYFFEKHSTSRKTLLWIAKNFPEISIRLYQSAYKKGSGSKQKDLFFTEKEFASRKDLIDFLIANQYNKAKIIEDIIDFLT